MITIYDKDPLIVEVILISRLPGLILHEMGMASKIAGELKKIFQMGNMCPRHF